MFAFNSEAMKHLNTFTLFSRYLSDFAQRSLMADIHVFKANSGNAQQSLRTNSPTMG